MSRRLLIDWLVCLGVLMLAYAGRGWLLAWVLKGRYPWLSLAVDVAVLALLICLFRALDLGLRVLFQRWFGDGANKRTSLQGEKTAETPENGRPSRFRRLALDATRFVIVFFLAAPFLVVLSQLHPQRIACAVTPGDLGLPFEDVPLSCDGLKLAAWYIPGESGQPAIFIAHGVGANKQNLLPVAAEMHKAGYPVMMLDFRAHGDSEGALTTLGMREAEDVKAALAWLRQRHPDRPICGIGYSMGAAALLQASADGSVCDSYVLDSAFARLENSARHTMASYYFPAPIIEPWWQTSRLWGWGIVGFDLQTLQPEQHVGALADRPMLLIHGKEDRTTSFTDSVRLQEMTGGKAELWLVDGAGHLQSLEHPDYVARVRRFLEGSHPRSR
jgi:alpha-beta hydrolase superfamily lysophospholipase